MKNRGKKYGLGGDIGKYMLNNLEASALGQFGLDFYKPKFDTSIMQGTNDIAQKVIGGSQKLAMGIASTQIPGLGAVQGIGKNIQFKNGGVIDPPPLKSKQVGDANRKRYGLDRPNNDTWLDVPQKVAMYMAGKGYRKPSDYLYANGLGDSSADELKAFIADALFDPLNLVGVGEVKNAYKAAKATYPLIKGTIKAADKIDLIDDTYEYGKKKASELNDWLGNTTGYKFPNGGKITGIGGALPINPGDLDKVTGNTLQYDGNAHSNGGIPLQNGAELEKDETVIKPGAIGNENPYALSPNITITEEAAKMFGLSKSDIGKSIADVSRTVEARKPKSQEKMAVKTNEMNKKFALDKLMKANEYLSSQMGDTGEKKPYGGELPLLPRQVGSIYQTRNPLEYVQPNYANLATVRNSDSVPEMDLYAKPQIPNANFWGTGKEMNINPINARSQTINPATNYNPVVENQTSPSPLTTAGGESTPLSSFNLGLGLKGAALLGELATIGGKPKNIPAQYNPYKSQIINNANLRIDNSAIKNDIASSLNTALNSSSGRSWASQRALNAQMMGNASDAQSKANLQSQEANNRYKEQLSQTYNNLGQQDVAARNQAEVLNAQTQAAWKQGIRAGIGNIGSQGADTLIKHQYVQDARKDGANLNMMQAKLLVDKWSGTFGGVDNSLIKLVMQAYPDQFKTEEEAKQYFSKITKK